MRSSLNLIPFKRRRPFELWSLRKVSYVIGDVWETWDKWEHKCSKWYSTCCVIHCRGTSWPSRFIVFLLTARWRIDFNYRPMGKRFKGLFLRGNIWRNYSELSYWDIFRDIHIQTLAPIVLFSFWTLSSHLMLILMLTGTLPKTFLTLTGVMRTTSTQMIDNPMKQGWSISCYIALLPMESNRNEMDFTDTAQCVSGRSTMRLLRAGQRSQHHENVISTHS